MWRIVGGVGIVRWIRWGSLLKDEEACWSVAGDEAVPMAFGTSVREAPHPPLSRFRLSRPSVEGGLRGMRMVLPNGFASSLSDSGRLLSGCCLHESYVSIQPPLSTELRRRRDPVDISLEKGGNLKGEGFELNQHRSPADIIT